MKHGERGGAQVLYHELVHSVLHHESGRRFPSCPSAIGSPRRDSQSAMGTCPFTSVRILSVLPAPVPSRAKPRLRRREPMPVLNRLCLQVTCHCPGSAAGAGIRRRHGEVARAWARMRRFESRPHSHGPLTRSHHDATAVAVLEGTRCPTPHFTPAQETPRCE